MRTKTISMTQKTNAVDFIKMLPDELIAQPDTIFDWLMPEELSRAGGVSREWKRLANDELLWKRLLTEEEQKYFAELKQKPAMSWKECVKEASEYGMKTLMGKQFTGSRDYKELFGSEALARVKIPALPEGIYGILNQPCPLTEKTEGEEKKVPQVKDTHLLFLQTSTLRGKGLSVGEWNQLLLEDEHKSQYKGGETHPDLSSWKEESLAKRSEDQAKWVLMPKAVMPDTTYKTWAEQEALMKARHPKYEISDGLSFVTGIMLHYFQTGERLYGAGHKVGPDRQWLPYARVTDIDSRSGNRIDMGDFDADGLSMFCWDDEDRDGDTGVAGLRNLDCS